MQKITSFLAMVQPSHVSGIEFRVVNIIKAHLSFIAVAVCIVNIIRMLVASTQKLISFRDSINVA